MSEQQQTLTTQQAIDLAVQHHNAGRLPEAENIYQQILQSEPNHPTALHLLGADPPPLSWSTLIVSKGGPSNGYQETSSGRDCYKITSG